MTEKKKYLIDDNLSYIVNNILPVFDFRFILTDNFDIIESMYRHTIKNPNIYIVRKLHYGQDALHFNISVKGYSNILHVYVGVENGQFFPLLITDLPYSLLDIPEEYLNWFLFNIYDYPLDKMLKYLISL